MIWWKCFQSMIQWSSRICLSNLVILFCKWHWASGQKGISDRLSDERRADFRKIAPSTWSTTETAGKLCICRKQSLFQLTQKQSGSKQWWKPGRSRPRRNTGSQALTKGTWAGKERRKIRKRTKNDRGSDQKGYWGSQETQKQHSKHIRIEAIPTRCKCTLN